MKKILVGLLTVANVWLAIGAPLAFAEESAFDWSDEGTVEGSDSTAPSSDVSMAAASDPVASGAAAAPEEGEGTTTAALITVDPTKILSSFQGKQEVDLFSGSLSYALPIVLPAGRRGLTPSIGLTYSSLNQSFTSPAGYGWSLPTNAIFRTSKTGVNTLYSADQFTADIFGNTIELVLVDEATNRYAAKDESAFTSYWFEAGSWRATDRNGTSYTFGSDSATRQDDPDDSTRVYKWLLEKVQDKNGNAIVFDYTSNGAGDVYPSTIFYGGTNASDAVYQVSFVLGERSAYTDYRTGFAVKHDQLIESIAVTLVSDGSEVITYDFDHRDESSAIQLLDAVTVSTPDVTLPSFSFSYIDGSESDQYKKLHALYRIDEPSGSVQSFAYQPATAYRESDGSGSNLFPFTVMTVKDHTVEASAGEVSYTTSYAYRNGQYYVDQSDAFTREYAGFGEVTVTDPTDESTVHYYHQSETDPHNSDNATLGEFADTIAKKGRQYRQERYDASGTLTQTQVTTWEGTELSDADPTLVYTFVYPSQTTILTYNQDASHIDSAEAFTYDTANGNLLTRVEYGSVTAASDGSYTDTGSDKRTTTTTYATDSSGSLLGAPSSVVLTDSSGTTVQSARYTYDGLSFGNVTTGNVSKQEVWISGTTYAATTFTYDAYGNVLTETDPLSNVTTTVYDSDHLFPVSITNALTQSKTISYDYAVGKPSRIVDVNGAIMEMDYDGFGRPTAERISTEASASTLVTTQTWSYNDTTFPRSTTQRMYLSASVFVEQITYVDGFDRTMEVKTLNENGTGYNETETTYDALGRVASQTLPAASALGNYDAQTVASALSESYTYDALGRPTALTNVLGTTSTSFSGLTKTVTDPLGNKKDYLTDSLGRLVSVVEYVDGVAYTTTYVWSAADKLTKLTDALGNIRNFTYDGRGLRLTAQDLHASADSFYGTWTYTYDSSGDLRTVLSPNAITTTYAYDALHRLTTETPSTGSATAYTYDACTNGTGQRCGTSVSGGATQSFAYFASGRMSSETSTVAVTVYTASYTYDYAGNILTTTEPDGSTVRYTYNALGLLETVERKGQADASYTSVVTSKTYGPHGQVTSENYGNGTSSTYTYNAAARYRLTRKQTTGLTASGGATTNFAPAAGDGAINHNHASWDTVHDALTGSTAAATATTAYVRSGKNAMNKNYLERAFLPFDTSSIPDTATITSAKLKVYVAAKTNDDNDGDDFVTVVQSSQPSTTTLTTADYDLDGSINTPTEGVDTAERKDISSVTTGGYLTFTLNATGRGFVSKTSATLLGLREGHDVRDSAFTGAANLYDALQFRTGEFAGTTSDPILEVTYSTPGAAITLQDLNYTYDATGNITQIVDTSATDAAKTSAYVYDDLYRLTSATISGAASGTNQTITYTYNAIGNITYRSDFGTYTYGGSTSAAPATKYANPHAVTSILKTDSSTKTFAYDTNGNVKSDGTLTLTWDYRNRLMTSKKGTTTTTFAYNADTRVSKSTSGTTTYYPTSDYSVKGSTTTVHVGSVATVDTTAGTSTIHTNHADHLGSTSVVTDSTGVMVELLDYYPYGSERLKTGTADEQKTYIGEYSDDESGLSYLNARYYDPARGQFMSQDGAYLTIGSGGALDFVLLLDPQQQNSYSYARNNPIMFTDPTGDSILSVFRSGIKYVYNAMVRLFIGNPQPTPTAPSTTTSPVTVPAVTTPTPTPAVTATPSSSQNKLTETWDPITTQRIGQLDSRLRQPATDFINAVQSELHIQLRVTQGYRSIEEQNALYEQGRTTPGNIVTNARGGQSYHNYGLAFDVVVMENGEAKWDKPVTQAIADIAADHGFEWGGSWSTFQDRPHFQNTFDQSLSDLQKK